MKSLRKGLSVVLVAVLILLPVTNVLAQQRGTDDAVRDAMADAEANTGGILWMGCGCLFGVFGIGAAYLIVPSPPTSHLLGKSPEYVVVYTDTYRSTARGIQTGNAIRGCLVGTAVSMAIYMLLLME